MISNATQHSPRLHRIARPVRVAVTVFVVLLLSMAGFIAGRYFQAPDLTTIKQSAAPNSVWSPVEERVVDDRQSFAAVVKAGTTISVPARSAIEPAVIVRQGLDAGALAQGGALAGVVSGQPYFLLPEPLPLFRNLYPGDSGDDVLALQRSMNAAGYPVIENATVDGLLMSQIAALFHPIRWIRVAHVRGRRL